ncbi:DUF432 domain-containing protein [Spirochaetia bacterium 38H-sp]|uniref:DUF432 domain-containing protein n=1 Tax=Rarispira pelagica TaxID=3141764 RepID=A0ABU9UC55_9SPIR
MLNIQAEENAVYRIAANKLRIYLRKRGSLLDMVYRYSKNSSQPEIIKIEEIPSHRENIISQILIKEDSKEISIKPQLPDRPIAVNLSTELRIQANYKATVYVQIPLWMQLAIMSDAGTVKLTELPSSVLSNTWLGTSETGFIAYSYKSDVFTEKKPPLKYQETYFAVPVSIDNKKSEIIVVEKLTVPTQYLFLYKKDSLYKTQPVNIIYKKDTELPQFFIEKSIQEDAEEIISYPREKTSPHMLALGESIKKIFSGI